MKKLIWLFVDFIKEQLALFLDEGLPRVWASAFVIAYVCYSMMLEHAGIYSALLGCGAGVFFPIGGIGLVKWIKILRDEPNHATSEQVAPMAQ